MADESENVIVYIIHNQNGVPYGTGKRRKFGWKCSQSEEEYIEDKKRVEEEKWKVVKTFRVPREYVDDAGVACSQFVHEELSLDGLVARIDSLGK